ncbi:blue-sensitive opsin-like [Clavelina lepadiformis]
MIIVIFYGKLIAFLRKVGGNNSLSENARSDTQATKMVMLMVAAFLICWLPYAGFAMYNVFNLDSQMDFALGSIPAYFAKSALIYNPLIYVGLNRQFRKCVIRMFGCIWKKQDDSSATWRDNSGNIQATIL